MGNEEHAEQVRTMLAEHEARVRGVVGQLAEQLAEGNRLNAETDKRAAKREAEYDARQVEKNDLPRRNVEAWERIATALETLASRTG